MTAQLKTDGIARQQRILGIVAAVAGVCGAASTIPFGAALQGILLLVLFVSGAGSAVMSWVDVPPAAAVAAAIGLSVAAVVGISTALAWLHWWKPTASCLVLSLAVLLAGVARVTVLHRRRTQAAPTW
jgi:CHASE2 domain-containing sensor protein